MTHKSKKARKSKVTAPGDNTPSDFYYDGLGKKNEGLQKRLKELANSSWIEHEIAFARRWWHGKRITGDWVLNSLTDHNAPHFRFQRTLHTVADFFWSTLGAVWETIPATLRPTAVEKHLPRYRWCVTVGNDDEAILTGIAHSAEKADEDASAVAAILRAVFSVEPRKTGDAFKYKVYFENGVRAPLSQQMEVGSRYMLEPALDLEQARVVRQGATSGL